MGIAHITLVIIEAKYEVHNVSSQVLRRSQCGCYLRYGWYIYIHKESLGLPGGIRKVFVKWITFILSLE